MIAQLIDFHLKQNKLSNQIIKTKVEINAINNIAREHNFMFYTKEQMEQWKQDHLRKVLKKQEKMNELIKKYHDNMNEYVLHNM
jgi:phosphopantothenate synthetase